jgi:hypothetical protein
VGRAQSRSGVHHPLRCGAAVWCRVKSSLHARDLPGRDAAWGDGNVSVPAGRLVSPERHKRSVALSPGQVRGALLLSMQSPVNELLAGL